MTNKKVPKSQKQYVRGIIHNLSLQRWTSQEIVDFLQEKNITIARRTVSQIRNAIEKSAEKWYIELRESRYKYIAHFKERIDSLLSYQKQLHEIIASSKKDEVKIKAISELTSIEMNIFSLWKQLPNLTIVDKVKQEQEEQEEEGYESTQIPPIDEIDERNRFDRWSMDYRPMSRHYVMEMTSKYGIRDESVESEAWAGLVQCPDCKRWFQGENIKASHTCITLAAATGRDNRWLNSSNGTSYGRDPSTITHPP